MSSSPETTRSRVLIIANLLKDDAAGESLLASDYFNDQGWYPEVFSFEGNPAGAPDFKNFDLILSLGGDGTLLYVARLAAALGIPVLPVNLGTLGFIAANRRESWRNSFEAWRLGKLEASSRMMLQVDVVRGNKAMGRFSALNDGVVSSQGIAKMIRLCLGVDGERFGSYRADGLIVATPTGSTAYNLAAGGPALHPEMPAIIINPICPFTLASRPLVLPSSEIVQITVDETRRSGALLTVDGQETVPLEKGDVVTFKKSPFDARLIVPKENIFYEALRSKLGWSGDLDA
ncbi:NAD kinase [bioreactor metagenome]|jgi:NAD+ kinase|uniref:NAD kinase n=2 Tax=root TaxID=1 RepID=A0A652ZY56_9SPIR|nr:NAD(+)/NADH kinase [Treponema sp.]VBB40712.1 putative inorganic polyphosphate/ATP-NAD kinase [uncultured Spirochaetota bacterium]HOI23849.1 NAD(+)/NADH kinase [Spirochaetales bacterium]